MLCVIAKLSDAATEKLASIRKTAFAKGTEIKPLYGHITIAAYTGEDESRFVQFCKKLLETVTDFEVIYDRIEVLDETFIVVASPAASEQLSSVHRRIAEKFRDTLDPWTKSDRWHPHTTLFYGPDSDLYGIRNRIAESFVPFAAEINRIEFSRILEDGYEIMDRLDLSPRKAPFRRDDQKAHTGSAPPDEPVTKKYIGIVTAEDDRFL